MKKILILLTCLFLITWSLPVFAVPVLQLDFRGRYYNSTPNDFDYNPRYDPETILAPGNVFTLYALMQESKKTSLDDAYYLSMALYPGIEEASPAPDFGSFVFNGKTYQATQDIPGYNYRIHYGRGYPDYHFGMNHFNFNSNNQAGDPPPWHVPEPITMVLLGFGLIGLAGLGRKFKK